MTVSDNVKRKILGTWLDPIREWGIEPVLDRTLSAVINTYRTKTVFPAKSKMFRAFIECPYDTISVVWIGQDPYHDGSATGLSFANERDDDTFSPSLRIMKREWGDNINDGSFDPTLLKYAQQGILLLNTALTVEQSEPKSHTDLWSNWTATFLIHLSRARPDLLYILFGKKAQAWKAHLVHGHTLNIVHPAAEAYSQGNAKFYGSRFFDKTNEQLDKLKRPVIVW